MKLRYAKTLITGRPGVGKTTLVRRIVERLPSSSIAGFLTTEICSKGRRSGFQLEGLKDERRTLAHVNMKSQHRVGKYGVDMAGFEEFLEKLDLLHPAMRLVVVDEIGKMELFSNRFRNLIQKLLDSDKQLLATIALHGQGCIQTIKQRKDIHLIEVTRDNREALISAVLV